MLQINSIASPMLVNFFTFCNLNVLLKHVEVNHTIIRTQMTRTDVQLEH